MVKIYTKVGDDGTTGLFGSQNIRVKKYDSQVETYGTVDELNSSIGVLKSHMVSSFSNGFLYDQPMDDYQRELLSNSKKGLEILDDLTLIQRLLFNISSQLAMDSSEFSIVQKEKLKIKDDDVVFLENRIDYMNIELDELREFILPSGHIVSSSAHLCRTICRRCERRIVELSDKIDIDPNVIKFVNRLSDYLFVLARFLNKLTFQEELKWKK